MPSVGRLSQMLQPFYVTKACGVEVVNVMGISRQYNCFRDRKFYLLVDKLRIMYYIMLLK